MPSGTRNTPAESERRAIAVLRTAYLASGRSQRDLSRATGMSQANISKLFAGQKSVMLSEFYRLCTALGLDPVQVVDDAQRR